MNRTRKAIYTLLLLILSIVLLETFARLVGLYVSRPFTVFMNEQGVETVRYELNVIKPEFSLEKNSDTFRIMIAGGSTSVGFPYHPRSSFGLRLQELLEQSLPHLRFEVVNIGKMSMYSGEIAAVVEEALEYNPDLMIVYTGQNEFLALRHGKLKESSLIPGLKNSALVRGMAEAAAGLERAILNMRKGADQGLSFPVPPRLSKSDYRLVLEQYRSSLESIIMDCQAARTPLILCTTAINLLDWPPHCGHYPDGLAGRDMDTLTRIIDKTAKLVGDSRYTEAQSILLSGLEQAPDFAPLRFQLGRVQALQYRKAFKNTNGADETAQGNADVLEKLRREAVSNLELAVSLEAKSFISHRAPPEFNDTILALANKPGLIPVDLEYVFKKASPPAPGFDLFDDQCHPNLKGQQLIARAIFDAMKSNGIPARDKEWQQPKPWDEKNFLSAHGLDSDFLYNVFLTMAMFVGIKKDLPDGSRGVRELLRAASRERPSEPLPLILETLVGLKYNYAEDPAGALSSLYVKNPLRAEASADRHFTESVDIRQGVLMARIYHGHRPPLEGLVREEAYGRARSTDKKKKPARVLDFYNLFIRLDRGGVSITKEEAETILLERHQNGTGL